MDHGIPDFPVGITTAPRAANYLWRTLDSVRAAGFSDITIYAEPESPIPYGENVVQNGRIQGVTQNWRRGMLDMLKRRVPFLMVQDDVVFCRRIPEFLAEELWPSPETAVVSLYCPAHYSCGRYLFQHDLQASRNTWGACAHVWQPEHAKLVVDSPVLKGWSSRHKLDMAIGKVLRSLKLEIWYFDSLAQHIGDVSSIEGHRGGAYGRRAAAGFPGEVVEAAAIVVCQPK